MRFISTYIFTIFSQSIMCKLSSVIVHHQHQAIEMMEKIISQYDNYFFVLYSVKNMDLDMKSFIEILPPFIHINYDSNYIPESFDEREKVMKIFLLENFNHFASFNESKEVFSQYSCNVFLTYNVSSEICLLSRVELAPGAFVVDMKENKLFSCFTRDEVLDLSLITENEMNSLMSYHRTYSNLNGKILKVMYIKHHSFFCRKDKLSGRCIFEGPDAKIVDALSKTLNFVPDIQQFRNDNNSMIWDELMNAVNRGDADFGAGSVMITIERLPFFTSFTWRTPQYANLFVNPTQELELKIILRSYNLFVYILVLIILILIVLTASTSTYLHHQYFGIAQYAQILLKTMVEQTSIKQLISSSVTRFTLTIWLILNIIISSTFKSSLSSVLIKPKVYDFRSLRDLIENGFKFSVDDWSYDFFLNDTSDTVTSRSPEIMRDDLNYYSEVCQPTKLLFQFRFALVHSEFSLVHLSKRCRPNYPLHKLSDIRFLLGRTMYLSIPMTKKLPYRRIFSRTISRLRDSGLMPYWYKTITMDSLKRITREYSFKRPLQLKHTYSFFQILGTGICIGLVVFLLELLKTKFDSIQS